MENLEKRSLSSDFEVRSSENGNVIVEGYAARFDDETVIGGRFAERIARGAFDKADMGNTVALFNHDWNMPLARVGRGLELEVDDKGLKYRFELGNQSYAKDLAENIRMGNVSTSSFGFTIADDTWERRDDGVNLRTINEVETLYDVSPTTQGAYPTTEVALRSMEAFLGEFFDEEVEAELRKLEEDDDEKRPDHYTDEEEETEKEKEEKEMDEEEEEEERAEMTEEEEEEEKSEEEEAEERVEELIDPAILPHPYSQAFNTEKKEPTEARNNKSNNQNSTMENQKKNSAPALVQGLGDTEARAAKQFSFGKMVKEAAQGRLTGLEAEMNQEARNEFQNAKVNVAGGVCIPEFVLRAGSAPLGVTDGNGSGSTVDFGGTIGLVDNGLVESFRPNDLAAQMGVRNLANLTGDVVFQVQTAYNATPANSGQVTAASPDEGVTKAAESAQFAAKTLSPTRYAAHTQVTDQMLAQSADDMGAFLAREIRTAIDRKFNADIVAKVDGAYTATTYAAGTANPLDIEAALLAADVPLENVVALCGTTAYRTLRALSHDAGSGMLFAGDAKRPSVMGYESYISSQVAAQDAHFFDKTQLVTGTWGGLNLIVDPYTDADKGVTRMIANVYRDVEILQAAAFAGLASVVAAG